MSNEDKRKPQRAPGRFMTGKQIVEKYKPGGTPVAETKMKRYDRKEVIDWDMERRRAEARARLLSRGFDVPEILQPKRPALDEYGDEIVNIDQDVARDISGPSMTGPKPAAPGEGQSHEASNSGPGSRSGSRPKPNRHVVASHASLFQTKTSAGYRIGHDEYDASDGDYQDDLTVEDVYGSTATHDDRIAGRVDELKATNQNSSGNIDLPDNKSNWLSQAEGRRKSEAASLPQTALEKRTKASKQRKAAKQAKERSNALELDKLLPKLAAYMVVSIVVGYILVLTYIELAKLIGN